MCCYRRLEKLQLRAWITVTAACWFARYSTGLVAEGSAVVVAASGTAKDMDGIQWRCRIGRPLPLKLRKKNQIVIYDHWLELASNTPMLNTPLFKYSRVFRFIVHVLPVSSDSIAATNIQLELRCNFQWLVWYNHLHGLFENGYNHDTTKPTGSSKIASLELFFQKVVSGRLWLHSFSSHEFIGFSDGNIGGIKRHLLYLQFIFLRSMIFLGSNRNSSVNWTHSWTFSGETKSIATFMQDFLFLTWCGHPAGMKTASPRCCSNVHGSTPNPSFSCFKFVVYGCL